MSFHDEKLPFVQFSGKNPSTEAIITWETKEVEASTVWYGLENDEAKLISTKSSDQQVKIHRIELTGLSPNKRYYYRVGIDGSTPIYRSSIFSFLTAPADDNTNFKFAAYSDSQQFLGLGWHKRICDAIAGYDDLSFVMEPGDICQNWDNKPDWNQFFAEASIYMRNTSYVPTLGNHDGYYPDEDPNAEKHWYEQYFGATDTSGDSHTFYYSFSWSNAVIIAAEIAKTGDENPKTERNRLHDIWLNNTLANSQDKDFRILFFHRQIFSAESEGDNEQLMPRITPIVEKYHVSLVLYGHHHHYERFLYHNHTYICLGGGGGQQFGANYFNTGEYSKSFNIGPSYTHFSVSSDSIEITTLSPENDVIDHCILSLEGSNAILIEEV